MRLRSLILRGVSLAGIFALLSCVAVVSVQGQQNGTLQPLQQNQQTQSSAQQAQQDYEQQLRMQQQAAIPAQPPGFPLPAEEQQYIEQLLQYWEGYSDQVSRYRCQFMRWHYDPVVCNFVMPKTGQMAAAVISRGKVRFSDPDKGMYEVAEQWQFKGPPLEDGGDPQYERPSQAEDAAANGVVETEKWICDGEKIYEYDYGTKTIYELTLPPEMQGEGLSRSPLPFVFGAKASELLERFWIRDITPKNLQGQQYWLEAWPKRVSDAQAYTKVDIILSRDPFLPMAIHMYAPNFDMKTNPSKIVFQFEEREINGKLDGLADFANHFINPRTPFGWRRVPRDLNQDPRDQQVPRVGENPGVDGR